MRHIPALAPLTGRPGEQGQVLAIFALVLVALIAGTGLVLDGGGAFVQRREQQAAADFGAMAGGIAYANTDGTGATRLAAARRRAIEVASVNGYTSGTVGGIATTVTVTTASDAGSGSSSVAVDITRDHANGFAAVIGQPTWPVGARARVVAGIPNAAIGAMPLIFNVKAFDDERPRNLSSPGVLYDDPGSGSNDIPLDSTTFNWTTYCTGSARCNADSTTVRDVINQGGQSTIVHIGDAIAPLNAGSHATLYTALEQWVGGEYPVALVNDAGQLAGWAMFHIDSIQGSSQKVLGGWFVSDAQVGPLSIVSCAAACAATTGTYVIKLAD